nr:NTP transferase domain-containing protein [Bacteroidales bacterium]
MKSIVVIPARYQSSRFPGKPLVSLLGKPMILWVAELSEKAVGKENVYVATDDERIAKVVTDAGYQVVMTSDQALTGTDRLAEVAYKVNADIYINVQGDEPLLDPTDIVKAIEEKVRFPQEVINGYCALSDGDDPHSVNIPTLIITEHQQMIYISRQT